MIKTVKSKMTTNSQLSTTESKKKKKTKLTTRIEMKITWRVISGGVGGGERGKMYRE